MRNPIDVDGVRHHGARLAALALCLMFAAPAVAHHAMGGATPSSGWEGLLSGLAHPVLGLDHFAFIIAAGLIAALHRRGFLIPVAFVAASLVGTGIHLLAWDLPAPELVIALTVILFGVLLTVRPLPLPAVAILAAASGVFHGYAYGESIVGAETTPLFAYLLGLALVQLAIGLLTQRIFKSVFRPIPSVPSEPLRWAGVVVGLVGVVFLATG